MGQLTEYEIKILTLIAETIGYKIYGIEDGAKEKDKLAYSTCLDDKEKTKYTKQAIKKLQARFKNCVPEVAPYITAFINVHPSDNSSYDERKETIIRNFFLHEYSAVIELLAELKPKDIEDAITIDIEHYIHYLGLNTIALEDFIQQFANAERYIGMLSILTHKKDISNETLSKLEKDISLIISNAQAITPDSIKAQLEPLINSNKDLEVIDKAVKKVTSKSYNEFRKLGDSLYNNLDELKKLSHENYLIGFTSVYEKLKKFLNQDDFIDSEDSLNDLYDERQKDPFYYGFLSIRRMAFNGVLKGILDELLIERLNDFDAAFNLPSSFNETKNYIQKGLYEMELMMDGKIIKMKYYNIPRALEKFNSLRYKYENNPKEALGLLEKYYTIITSIDYKIDKGDFDNTDAYSNETFAKFSNDIHALAWNIFNLFTQEEIDATEPKDEKVLDILNPSNVPTLEPVQVIKTKKETSIHIAFTYSKKLPKDQNNLTEFRKSLIEGGFIDKSTKLTDFKKLFRNELPDNLIIWLGGISELYYLIKTLHNDKKLIDNTGKEVWKITSNCFIDTNGNQFDWAKFRGQKIPVSSKKLDKIISVL